MIKKFIKIIKEMKPLFVTERKKILFLFFSCGIMLFVSVFSPVFVSDMIAAFLKMNFKAVIMFLVIIGCIKIFNLFMSFFNIKVFYMFRKNFLSNMKTKISYSILNFDMITFSLNGKGKYLQRINNDPEKVAACLNSLKDSLLILLTNFGALIVVFFFNFYVGLLYLFFVLLIMRIRNIGIKRKIQIKKIAYEKQEMVNDTMSEIFNGMQDVKQLNLKNKIGQKSEDLFNQIEDLHLHADYIYSIYDKISYVLEWGATLLILLVVMFFYKNEFMNMEQVLSVFMYRRYIFSCVDSVSNFLNLLSEFNLCGERILEIITFDENSQEKDNYEKCCGSISFRGVDFSYGRETVLQNCSFTISAGDKVLIVGESGSGKTTILNLITKIYSVEDGKIFIDGIDINSLSEEYIRKNVSVISQYYYLFDMSIKDNLMMVKPNLTDEEMICVCKKVGIHNFIMSLPEKYETIIGAGGYSLSGGQRQRLAIARTLLLDSKIILFDEVTSSLDSESEKLILGVIEELEKNHTIIVVSHHSEFFHLFSKIMVLHNHKIEKKGSHVYLLKNSDTYKKICYRSSV